MISVVRAELVKIRSVRSTYIVLAATASVVVINIVMAWIGVGFWDSLPPERRVNFQALPIDQSVGPLIQLCMAVLAVLAITSEYATGMIRVSLTAVPARHVFLAAKALVVAGITLVVALTAVLGSYLTSRLIVADRPIPGATGPLTEELARLLSVSLATMVAGLVGLGLGAITRSATAAITAVATLLFVLPTIANLLPPPWGQRLGALLLPNLAGHLARGELFALAGMAIYLAAVAIPATALIVRRDA
ncbi:ABC transporter permease [Nonomuraea sp. 10N515B]|uniref:ABC transporter permease n=1 Tax=Nonomuraea sp. 10N515B TaxID=3457422 RepID=UPI003FCCFF43